MAVHGVSASGLGANKPRNEAKCERKILWAKDEARMNTEQQEESFMEQLQAVRAANARFEFSLC